MSESNTPLTSQEQWDSIKGVSKFLAVQPKVARDVALPIAAIAKGRPIRDFGKFVSRISGVELTFANAAINQSERMGELNREMDVTDAVFIYTVNEKNEAAVEASQSDEIKLQHGAGIISRERLEELVELKLTAQEADRELEIALRGLRRRGQED